MKVRIVGRGRAGRSLELALGKAGVAVEVLRGRSPATALAVAADGVDAVLLTVPDRFVADVAAAITPSPTTAVLHCSGSLGLEVLDPHPRRGSLHPLATLPDEVIGSMRLRGGAFFAVSGDGAATDLALALGGRPIVVDAADRAAYHAAACVASNHLVALLGQVQRIAAGAGLPLEAFLPLARGAIDDVAMLGPAAALTGPAARGDLATIEAHRAAIGPAELAGYDAGVDLARRVAEPAHKGAAALAGPLA
ncbi:MAG TPA: DUF2520 domain-containing protein [Acidimicrobiales bacterium]|nr:DUF2520 domain-containing protein [Acidimicrobiales bacterium]